jgi:hypothetical protein
LDLSGISYPILLIGTNEEPFSAMTNSILIAVKDAISYSNSQGGVFGAAIELHYVVAGNSEDLLEETFLESIKKVDPLVVFMAAPVSEELYDEIQRARIPVLYFGIGAHNLQKRDHGKDYLFWLTPLPDEQYAFFLEQTWKNWQAIRPPGIMNEFRIGYLTWEEPPNQLAITPGLDDYYQQNNFYFLLESSMRKSANASITNFLLQAITSGINVIYTDTINFGPMVMLNDIHSLGLKDFFVVGGSCWSYDTESVQYLAAPEMAETYYLPLPTTWWTEEDQPAIILANQIRNKVGGSASKKNLAYLMTLGAVDITSYIIRQEITNANEGELLASDLYDQLSNLTNYFVLEGLYEIDYTNGNRSPKILRLWAIEPDHSWNPVDAPGSVPHLSNSSDE